MMWRFLVCFSLLATPVLATSSVNQQLSEAYQTYSRGERAQTVADRAEAFNRSLALYGELAEAYPNAKLLFNVGNCYFQLGEPAWAILYYEKALRKAPREEKTARNLTVVRSKAGLHAPASFGVMENLLFFHFRFAEGEKLALFSILALLSFVLLSLGIWLGPRIPASLQNGLLGLTLLILGSLLYGQYLAPVEGILVRASALHRDAGDHYASVVDDPLPAGAKVVVQEAVKKGAWMKVKTKEGAIGFVSQEAIRII